MIRGSGGIISRQVGTRGAGRIAPSRPVIKTSNNKLSNKFKARGPRATFKGRGFSNTGLNNRVKGGFR